VSDYFGNRRMHIAGGPPWHRGLWTGRVQISRAWQARDHGWIHRITTRVVHGSDPIAQTTAPRPPRGGPPRGRTLGSLQARRPAADLACGHGGCHPRPAARGKHLSARGRTGARRVRCMRRGRERESPRGPPPCRLRATQSRS